MGLRSNVTCLTASDDPRGMLVEAIERWGGRLNWVAHDLGIDRKRLYLAVEKLGLWPTVNRARVKRHDERIQRRAACPIT